MVHSSPLSCQKLKVRWRCPLPDGRSRRLKPESLSTIAPNRRCLILGLQPLSPWETLFIRLKSRKIGRQDETVSPWKPGSQSKENTKTFLKKKSLTAGGGVPRREVFQVSLFQRKKKVVGRALPPSPKDSTVAQNRRWEVRSPTTETKGQLRKTNILPQNIG